MGLGRSMKVRLDDLRRYLAGHPLATSPEACLALSGINRSTLMRLVAQLDDEVVRRGGARRSRYALRRPLRGRMGDLPLYRVDTEGNGHVVGALAPLHPNGCALDFSEPCRWPLAAGPMQDGWFEGIPYPLQDMKPSGFLGRNFAHQYGRDLGVPENLNHWTDDDVLSVLAVRGHDQSGDLILGDRAYERHLEASRAWEETLVTEPTVPEAYPRLAELALAHGVVGSSAAGEFPKFTALRMLDGNPAAVIVKFSGAEASAAVQRWSDLLVCEHLALETLATALGILGARSAIRRHAGRTFLEVVRFDRQGALGRLPLCTLASLDNDLIGRAGAPWPALAADLARSGWLPPSEVAAMSRIWWFGRLIANTDMHLGNVAFFPGLTLAPVYDMLPMGYAPQRGGEVPPYEYAPARPLPADEPAWRDAGDAALTFWQRGAEDSRISEGFRAICLDNHGRLREALS